MWVNRTASAEGGTKAKAKAAAPEPTGNTSNRYPLLYSRGVFSVFSWTCILFFQLLGGSCRVFCGDPSLVYHLLTLCRLFRFGLVLKFGS